MERRKGQYLSETNVSWNSVANGDFDEITWNKLTSIDSRYFPISHKMSMMRNQLIQCLQRFLRSILLNKSHYDQSHRSNHTIPVNTMKIAYNQHIPPEQGTKVILIASSTLPIKTETPADARSSRIRGDSLNWFRNLMYNGSGSSSCNRFNPWILRLCR